MTRRPDGTTVGRTQDHGGDFAFFEVMEGLRDIVSQTLAQGVSFAQVVETYKPDIVLHFHIDKRHVGPSL
jgi:hypothetical protein